jgi:hypothetical protein
LHTEITLVDDGWLRILAAGGPTTACSLLSLDRSNPPLDLAIGLVVAFDVAGGFFAIDGGGLGGKAGEISDMAPDTLEWQGTELGHGDWLRWSFAADLERYYQGLRWRGWPGRGRRCGQ